MKGSEGSTPRGMGAGFELPPLTAAAHELKSPLALVRQLALTLEQPDLTEAEKRVLLDRIVLSSERALRLTSDLTRAARLDDGLFGLEPINPVALMRDIAVELEPLFQAYGRTIHVQARTHPLLLVANRDLLRRIIMNFSDNALHYAGADSAVEIQINALQRGRLIRVGVRDYGPALSSDMWRKLQHKLGSSAEPVHARPQSSGLGLYIASEFARAMQGTIGATRHRDGATFYVELAASGQLSLL